MCMPTPNNVSGFGYSWGFTSSADLTKGEVETPSSLSYTLGNTVRITMNLDLMSLPLQSDICIVINFHG